MAESLMRIALRTAGRLLVLGILTREQAASLIRNAWVKNSFELLPAGSTSTPAERGAIAAAANTEHWCNTCPEKCPSCRDDEKRAS